jgi:hypothetical protein
VTREKLNELLASCTKRTHLVAALIEAFGFKSYLEIGCRKDETFAVIKCDKKVGVDPIEGGTHRMTSDEFFAQNTDKFDIIFIDGDHHHDQVFRDIISALGCLTLNGIIVMHDCSPPDADHEGKRNWKCGTAWRAFAVLRQDLNLDMITADWDYGSGIIRMKNNSHPIAREVGPMDQLTYADFAAHKHDWMLLSTQQQVADWIWRQLNEDRK